MPNDKHFRIDRNIVDSPSWGMRVIWFTITLFAMPDLSSAGETTKTTSLQTDQASTRSITLERPIPAKSPTLEQKPILGLTRAEVTARFAAWSRDYRFEQANADGLKFCTDAMCAVIYFSSGGKADGVSFISNSPYLGDAQTGLGSYVQQNYQALLYAATGGKPVPVIPSRHASMLRIGEPH